MNQPRIKIYCRSFDLRLYRLSKGLYESWGFPCVRLTDQTADGYFYTMLRDTDCDIALNVDEDCFITNREAVMDLVSYVWENSIANAGCPDGGGCTPRGANPLVTNPFFNVLNLNLLREKFSKRSVKAFDYAQHRQEMQTAYPAEFIYEGHTPHFERNDFEPYYQFFLWQAYTTKTLYLHSKRHADGFTTLLYNPNGVEICRHTWFARFYSVPAFVVKHWQPTAGAQKTRIDNVINEAYVAQHLAKPVFGFADEMSFVGNKIIRWCVKVPQRICGWPKKLARKLSNA